MRVFACCTGLTHGCPAPTNHPTRASISGRFVLNIHNTHSSSPSTLYAMSGSTQITSPQQFSTLLASSRLVVVNCKLPCTPTPRCTAQPTDFRPPSLQRVERRLQDHRPRLRPARRFPRPPGHRHLRKSQRRAADADCAELWRHKVSLPDVKLCGPAPADTCAQSAPLRNLQERPAGLQVHRPEPPATLGKHQEASRRSRIRRRRLRGSKWEFCRGRRMAGCCPAQGIHRCYGSGRCARTGPAEFGQRVWRREDAV